ncbi:MAG: DUF1592 domain-containing protein [Planctomycetes bacterium]|nr:DUF1592 domain-containing protein [Planctomycetota bacterium]MDA0946982.1 DUF1592 domain-containing protein [Planctomycetota bacterium]
MLTYLLLLAAAPGPVADVGAPQEARRILERSCMGCHDSEEVEGGFDLERLLAADRTSPWLFEWRRASAALEIDAMPPKRKLGREDRRVLLEYLAEVEARALEEGGGPGYEPLRRLTRTELENSLSDLLEVDVQLAALLPDELASEGGFEASSATLFVHPDWLERVGAAVRIVLRSALPDEGRASLRGDPEEVLPRLMRRAWRRSLTEAERLEAQGRLAELQETLPPRAALREALAAALASPHFLMRLEDVQVEPGEVGPFALASRLSFFLWASGPDERLLDLAAQGTLADPRVLEAQIGRMLEDHRALALGEGFAAQWLRIGGLGTVVKPDPIDVPFMTDSVMAAMREEVARFFLELVVADHPLEALLQARFSYLNEELADFYGVEGVRGERLRRVARLPAERTGVLGKAAVLATTAFPDRTSPVVRGNWVLSDLLGTPPPPPPPGASEFDEELMEELEELSAEGRMALHRRKPSCAACHDRIDPLGLALEDYDRFGRLRDEEDRLASVTGTLPGGARFRGVRGLREGLVEHAADDLARQASRRLLAYALGRPLTWSDERTVVDLATKLREEGWGALVRAVIASRPFRHQEQAP